MQLIGMFLQKLISLLSFNPPEDETRSDACAGREPNVQEQKMQKPPQDTRSGRRRIRARRKSAVSQNRVLPRRIEGINLGSKQDSSGEISPPDDSPSTGKTDGCEMKPLTKGLDANLNALKKILHHGTNADVVIREFDIPTVPETRA